MAEVFIDDIKKIVENIYQGEAVSYEQAKSLLDSCGSDMDSFLWGANNLRDFYFGNEIETCSIVNAKNGKCSEDCNYCAQAAKFDLPIDPYALLPETELKDKAFAAQKTGVNHFSFVTSGRKLAGKDLEELTTTIENLSADNYSTPMCASFGLMEEEELRKFKEAGLTRFHHNLETSERNFAKVCTTHSYADRVQTIKNAKAAGLQVCAGVLLGLNETHEDWLELAFALRELDVDSIPMNFLSAILGTPAESNKKLEPLEILKAIAIFRFINPDKMIRICGGRKNLRSLESSLFRAGASGMMIGNYLVTKGDVLVNDLKMIEDLGLVRKG